MSHYLDDWDSVNFAMALKDFSLALGKPQPPGYPVYVALGRVVDLLFHDTTKTLTVISAVSGSLSLIPTYLIARDFFGDRTAILASVLLTLAPAHLLFSEVAMTDMVSLLFLTTTVYLLYRGMKSARYTYLASFAMGITMGIRWTDILLAPLFLEALYGKRLKSFAISVSLAIARDISLAGAHDRVHRSWRVRLPPGQAVEVGQWRKHTQHIRGTERYRDYRHSEVSIRPLYNGLVMGAPGTDNDNIAGLWFNAQ